MTAVVLVAHGSPDPRSGAAAHILAGLVQERIGLVVRAAFLQHDDLDVETVTRRLAHQGERRAIVVPALLSEAYHARVDVPAALDRARVASGLTLRLAAGLGADASLLPAVDRRLPDGPRVLAVAGTSDERAQHDLDRLAASWSQVRSAPALVGHASQADPDVATAISRVEREAGSVASVGTFVLFPGILADGIASAAGDRPTSAPLFDAPETVELVSQRVDAVIREAA